MIADEIKNKILSHIEEHFSEEEVSIASSKFQIEIPDSPEGPLDPIDALESPEKAASASLKRASVEDVEPAPKRDFIAKIKPVGPVIG